MFLDERTVDKLLNVRNALKLEQLHLGVQAAVQWHYHFPRARVGARILDRGFVIEVVRRSWSKALGHDRSLAEEISCPVEPNREREASRVNDECVSLPLTDRFARPGVDV